ncbi:Hint domain-containing protein [Kitasatospora sp. NPDC050467]|uniref:Hint domain-containing protein n=1 Tax=Kitasatospora sp. NPDC050467 TaxID=3364053 RepID=UPI0037AB4C7B
MEQIPNPSDSNPEDAGYEAGGAALGPIGAEESLIKSQAEAAAAARSRFALTRGAHCSFTPETEVLMADGSTKPISDVAIGDEVLAADQNDVTNQGPEQVAATWVHNDSNLVDISIRAESGEQVTIHTTMNHPFWDDTTQEWGLQGCSPKAITSRRHPGRAPRS